jgi:Family of unknown function (DUF5565)
VYVKRDGTACLWQGGKLYKRYDVKRGKVVPPGAIPCDPEADPVTGHWPHWVLVGEEPESRWHREARNESGVLTDGTYELCGPKLQGNPEKFHSHFFVKHDSEQLVLTFVLAFDTLREYLGDNRYEGIVFHHADGRMVKIRRDDFGFEWPVPAPADPGPLF